MEGEKNGGRIRLLVGSCGGRLTADQEAAEPQLGQTISAENGVPR